MYMSDCGSGILCLCDSVSARCVDLPARESTTHKAHNDKFATFSITTIPVRVASSSNQRCIMLQQPLVTRFEPADV